MKARTADVAIVGAGLIGLFCGLSLAARGVKVVILERKTPGSGSSTRNGGGVRSQWGTATNIRLSVLSEQTWASFEGRFGVDPDLRRIGYLFLAHDPAGAEELGRRVALQRGFGVASEFMTASEIGARWPSLAHLEVVGASFCATDGFLNQHRVLQALTQAVVRAGVVLESGTEVTAIDVNEGRITGIRSTRGSIATDTVVNCAGAWVPELAASIDTQVPIRARRVQLLIAVPTRPLAPDLPWIIESSRQVHVRHDVDGRVQVGGFLHADETVDPRSFDHDADPSWTTAVIEQLRLGTGIRIEREAVVDSWAGLYPSTPDQHPILDRTEAGMVVVGGFAGAGLMHGPAAGQLAAELIVDGRMSSIDAAEVSLARFDEPPSSVEQTGF